jgi:hypothetical protein
MPQRGNFQGLSCRVRAAREAWTPNPWTHSGLRIQEIACEYASGVLMTLRFLPFLRPIAWLSTPESANLKRK